MAETLTTELEAVNVMLRAIGEAPVNSITVGPIPAEVQIAVDLLHDVSRKVQLTGWYFNTEEEVELLRDTNNQITLGGNVIAIDLHTRSTNMDLVPRGLRLYDKKNHTYTLTENPKVDIIYYLPWTELPEAAREHIKVKAARVFVDQTLGAEALHSYTKDDELESFYRLREDEAENLDATIFDNWDIGSIVARRRVWTTI